MSASTARRPSREICRTCVTVRSQLASVEGHASRRTARGGTGPCDTPAVSLGSTLVTLSCQNGMPNCGGRDARSSLPARAGWYVPLHL